MVTLVDKLDFLVLVDDCVEWMSTLPPGFNHEVSQHLLASPPHSAPKDPLTGLPVLDLENYCCAAHGLSILIVRQTTEVDGKQHRVLMDAGPESKSIERNARAMHVPLQDLDAIVLSHWHADHSGGIVRALQMRQEMATGLLNPLTVDLHPERPLRRGISRPPDYIPFAALPPDPTFDDITQAGGKVDFWEKDHEIMTQVGEPTGVGVSGEIKRVLPFEKGLPGAVTWMEDENAKGGWFTDELIMDERYVVVDVKGKGLVIFSSCSHAGICNVIIDAMVKYHRPIHMIVDGLHLVPVHQQPVDQTVNFIARRIQPPPAFVVPLHCTGLEPRSRLLMALGDACVPAGVGMRVIVQGDEAKEAELENVAVEISK